jgi:hypothetical protein
VNDNVQFLLWCAAFIGISVVFGVVGNGLIDPKPIYVNHESHGSFDYLTVRYRVAGVLWWRTVRLWRPGKNSYWLTERGEKFSILQEDSLNRQVQLAELRQEQLDALLSEERKPLRFVRGGRP